MKEQKGLWHMQFVLLVVVLLLMLIPGRSIGETKSSYAGLEKQTLTKELGLTSEQAKTFQKVGDKFEQSREGIIAGIKNNERDLEKALSSPKPDETKIKELVVTVTQGHDQLMQTFKAQRQEEMALLTPVQQGRFLLVLKKWHEEMNQSLEK